jgi:hypothetical protein
MERKKLENLIRKNYSIRKIAKELSKTPSTIRYWLDKFGLKTSKAKGGKYCCKLCGETSKKKMANKGGGRISYSICKSCHSSENTKRGRERKKMLVEHKGGSCIVCGYSKCIAALEFHHQDPNNKDPKFRALRYWSLKRAMDEVDKCYLLCSNCHREAHWGLLNLDKE